MSQATSANERRVPASAKIPLRLRLKAWWDGHDIRVKEPGASAAEAGAVGEAPAPDPFVRWNPAHLEVLQAVWGEGMVGPSNPEEIRHLVKPLGLNPAMSVLNVGAGLGGPGRIMAESFGVWITGLESVSELVKAGMAQSEAVDLGKKAPVVSFDPDTFEPKAGTYDCVISLGYLFTVKNRMRLLESLTQALKPSGQILITDFVLAKPGVESPVLKDWMAFELEEVEPWSVEQYKVALEGGNLEVRITEDLTAVLRNQVVKTWADHMEAVGEEAANPQTSSALVHEVELWTRRIKALDNGDLRLCRLYAKGKSSSNLLSDW